MSGSGVLNGDSNGTCYPFSVHDSFAESKDNQFMVNGKPLYFNGFNAYWLMCVASDPSTKTKVTNAFQEASKIGMNIVRTWGFSDGGNKPLQTSPGVYNEDMFKGLDFVISEAKKHGLKLILSLVNNWDDFGGKKQYVQWVRDHGSQSLNSDDDFFTNAIVKQYFKNHVKSVLTRHNSITGVAYKDDPTIFAWELMNEPRCQSDLSGKTLEEWIVEMAAEVKSIDNIDFATIHLYPDQWVSGGSDEDRAKFVEKWISAHIEDCKSVLKKPLLIAEFGKSSWSAGYTVESRDEYFKNIFNMAYESAKSDGSCSGTTFWQVMAEGMENWGDGYQVVLEESPSTAAVISQQSQKISSLNSS